MVPQAILSGQLQTSMSFNEKAWTICCRVPAGKVTTYGAIARALGSPKSARAVGTAMNRNPFAPAVPCHRVIGGDRALTGYAGGLEKKRLMLEEEGVVFAQDLVDPRCILATVSE